jgi:hypothetical protein
MMHDVYDLAATHLAHHVVWIDGINSWRGHCVRALPQLLDCLFYGNLYQNCVVVDTHGTHAAPHAGKEITQRPYGRCNRCSSLYHEPSNIVSLHYITSQRVLEPGAIIMVEGLDTLLHNCNGFHISAHNVLLTVQAQHQRKLWADSCLSVGDPILGLPMYDFGRQLFYAR